MLAIFKPVNSNLGGENSLSVYAPLLPWLCTLKAVWLVRTQQKQEMRSLKLHMNLQAWLMVILYGKNRKFISCGRDCAINCIQPL